VRLIEAGLRVGDVDLGGFDAESDHKLAADFVRTPVVDAALGGRKHLFLGRKGSGKSALFRQMPVLIAAEERGRSVVEITPSSYAWVALRSYREQGLALEQAHTHAWKFTLAIEMSSHLVGLEREWPGNAFTPLSALKRFVEANFGKQRTRGLLPATSLIKGLESFDLSALGFGIGLSRRELPEQALTPALIEVLLDHLIEPLTVAPLLIELDRLDDAWDGSADSHSSIVGLLKAAKDINDTLRRSAASASGVLVFLRTDIYDQLQFDDKDKHRPFEQPIHWTTSGLRDLISRRLPDGVDPDGLFEPGRMRGSSAPFEYLLRRTFLRPREVLQFLQLCLEHAGVGAPEVKKETVRSAEVTFSQWKVADLKQEYSKASPDLAPLLEALRLERHRFESYDELVQVLQRKEPSVVERLGARSCLELLFETSVIGVRPEGAGATRFKSREPTMALPPFGRVYVHQGLVRGLHVREARRLPEIPGEFDDDWL
jgi:energy-coupling factor transporter ATP-binding protein EcfA2